MPLDSTNVSSSKFRAASNRAVLGLRACSTPCRAREGAPKKFELMWTGFCRVKLGLPQRGALPLVDAAIG